MAGHEFEVAGSEVTHWRLDWAFPRIHSNAKSVMVKCVSVKI